MVFLKTFHDRIIVCAVIAMTIFINTIIIEFTGLAFFWCVERNLICFKAFFVCIPIDLINTM